VDAADWYRVDLVAGVTYHFDTVGGSGDDYGQLYSDAAGTVQVAFNDDGGGGLQFSLDYTAASTQRYYLKVRTYTAGASWSGSLRYWLVVPVSCTVQPGIICTVAGSGTPGFNGDGIPALNAQLTEPIGIAVDSLGNIYVADYMCARVRRVDAATGLITTVAGTGVFGYNGDGKAATLAQLNWPVAVAVDAPGNVYIADFNNHRVRRVAAGTGMITTVAGDGTAGYNGDGITATTAQINWPAGVLKDASGDLYISEYGGHRVRRVDVGTGLISTVAGDGTPGYNGDGIMAATARLDEPFGIALDVTGNLYIADSWNNRIRRVDSGTGLITTVAGDGSAGYNGDGIPATTARLNDPYGVALDGTGYLYIADSWNNRIRRVDPGTGMISTAAGGATAGYNGDGILATTAWLNWATGVAVDGAGNFYIADASNYRIREVGAIAARLESSLTTAPIRRWWASP